MNHPILDSLFTSVPMIVVALGALVTAIVLWRKAPLSSLLVVIACITSIGLLIIYPFAYKAAQHLFATDAESSARIRTVFGVCWSIARATYLILLVIAVYAGRQHHEEERAEQTGCTEPRDRIAVPSGAPQARGR
jgi:NADH:ubiquinone oxidoreductase subunit 5 (subunit L)/multisubunit Na+/H+ antiporter MnhA subunit